MRYIGTNRTMYSRDDLNDAIEAFLAFTRNVPDLLKLCPEMVGWEFKQVRSKRLPLKLYHWKNWEVKASVEPRCLSNNLASLKTQQTAGPWFIDDSNTTPDFDTPLNGMGIIHAKNIPNVVEGMEALATLNAMPEWCLAQFLFYICRNLGIRFRSEAQIISCVSHIDEKSLLGVCIRFVQREKLHVRILPQIEDPLDKIRSTKEERLQQLYQTYTSGGAKEGMDSKTWTLRHATEQYFDFWKQSEVQRRRAERAGIKIERPHLSPSDVLRRLAQQYDDELSNMNKDTK